jgi:hypothetical protein
MKIIRRGLALALLCCIAFAQTPQATWQATLTATGTTASFASLGSKYFTVQVVLNAAASACTYRIEGSNDGSHWDDWTGTQSCIGTLKDGTPGNTISVDGKPARYLRANLLTFTGASSATFSYIGTER